MKDIFYLIALCCFNFVFIFFFLQKMSSDIQNYDYSFICHLYDAICNIPDREDYPIDTLHDIETLEDACELQMDSQRHELRNLNGGYEFYTPLDSADFLVDRVYVIYNECPDPSLCPGLEALKNIACEREEVRAEHRDLPYPPRTTYRRHN